MDRAVRVHTEQAELFGRRYRELEDAPHRSAFHYGRARIRELLAERLGPGAGRRALDAGCGSGDWLRWLAERGYEVRGIDGSPGMLAQARPIVGGERLARADVRALPFASGAFDLALSVEVVRYLPDGAPALGELFRVLRPGGTAVVTAASRYALHGYALLNPLFAALRPRGFTRLRQHFTTAEALAGDLAAAGFVDVDVLGLFLGPFVWFDRLAPRLSQAALARWRRVDRILEALPGTRDLANHLVAFGRKAA